MSAAAAGTAGGWLHLRVRTCLLPPTTASPLHMCLSIPPISRWERPSAVACAKDASCVARRLCAGQLVAGHSKTHFLRRNLTGCAGITVAAAGRSAWCQASSVGCGGLDDAASSRRLRPPAASCCLQQLRHICAGAVHVCGERLRNTYRSGAHHQSPTAIRALCSQKVTRLEQVPARKQGLRAATRLLARTRHGCHGVAPVLLLRRSRNLKRFPPDARCGSPAHMDGDVSTAVANARIERVGRTGGAGGAVDHKMKTKE